jgi:hypothetical protein
LASNQLVLGGEETGYVKKSKVQGESFEIGAKVMYQGRKMIVTMAPDSDGYIKMKPLDLSGILALAEAVKANKTLQSIKWAAQSINTPAVSVQSKFEHHFATQHFMKGAYCQGPMTLWVPAYSLNNNSIGAYIDYEKEEMVPTPEGPAAIAEMLKVNKTITSIRCSLSTYRVRARWRWNSLFCHYQLAYISSFVWCLSCHSLADNALVSQTGYIKASKVEGASKEAGAKVMYQGREMVVSKGINRDGEMKMWDFSGIAALAEGLKQNCSLTSIKWAAHGTEFRASGTHCMFSAHTCCPRPSMRPLPVLLSLSGNQLCGIDSSGGGTYTSEGITQISEALKVNQMLQSIKYASHQTWEPTPHIVNHSHC